MGLAFDANVEVDVGKLGGAACGGIEYPVSGFYGDNILVPSYDSIRVRRGESVEIAAKLPPGAALTIKMTWIEGPGGWSDELGTDFLVKTIPGPVSPIFTQVFQAKVSGQLVENGLRFADKGRTIVEYYECGSATPNGTKIVSWDISNP
jgi:hypothetical protein